MYFIDYGFNLKKLMLRRGSSISDWHTSESLVPAIVGNSGANPIMGLPYGSPIVIS